jgi:hypothetical protein
LREQMARAPCANRWPERLARTDGLSALREQMA